MRSVRHVLIVVLLVGTALALDACTAASQPPSSPLATDAASSSVRPAGAQTPLAPGRSTKRGGRIEVIGTLQRDDSGSLLVVGALPSQAAGAHVLAVIVNPGSVGGVDLSKLDNAYVRVTGTPAQGIATDSSGLGIVADKIATITVR